MVVFELLEKFRVKMLLVWNIKWLVLSLSLTTIDLPFDFSIINTYLYITFDIKNLVQVIIDDQTVPYTVTLLRILASLIIASAIQDETEDVSSSKCPKVSMCL